VKGGEIVAEDVPETVAKAKGSFTGRYFAPLLKGRGVEAVAAA
jgi:excinuclease ABC subunit A